MNDSCRGSSDILALLSSQIPELSRISWDFDSSVLSSSPAPCRILTATGFLPGNKEKSMFLRIHPQVL
jgi:hypothetical protein